MKFRHAYHNYCYRLIACLLLCVSLTISAKGQLSKTIFRTKVLYDTLIANSNRDFKYNNTNIQNLTSDSISILVEITPPEGWELTTQRIQTLSLPPNGNTIVSLRLLPSGSKTAEWQTAYIQYRLNSGIETLTDSFKVKVEEYLKFKGRLPQPTLVMTSYQKDINFPVYLKNSGNTADHYSIKFYNKLLDLNFKQTFALGPSEDTTYYIPLRLTDAQWSLLRKEEVKVQVGNSTGETINLIQYISRIGNILKENKSAFLDMPTQVEVGVTSQSNQGNVDLQYYGALHGRLDLSYTERVAFDLRSNTYTNGQTIENSIVRAEYSGKHWSGTLGNFSELADFVMDGYGAKVGYNWKQDANEAEVYSMFKSRTGDSKVFGANVHLTHKNLKFHEIGIANIDNVRQLNSFIFKQGGDIIFSQNAKLKMTAGAGLEQTLNPNISQKTQIGSSFGYNFLWNHKYFSVTSGVLYNSNSYPGVFKGQRMQTHDVRAIYKNVFIGGFYEYNLRKQNIYLDTALFSDVFNLRTESYGARIGGGYKGANINLAAGQQLQLQTDTTAQLQYVFNNASLNASVLMGKNFYLTLNAQYGEGYLEGQEENNTVFVTNNQGSIQFKFIGVSGRYVKGPFYYYQYISYLKDPTQEFEQIQISPYAELNLFKKKLLIRSQFNYAKSQPSGIESSNLLSNLVYNNYKHGFDLNVSGIIPINQGQGASPYVNASLRVRLHVPFVAVRKYYNLKVVLYKDANSNNKKDPEEEGVEGQMLAIDGSMFITDNAGTALFKNVQKADYKIDMGYSSKIKGWAPTEGALQYVNVSSNKTLYIPFKKSRVLQGQLKVDLDKNSNLDFKLGNIKVTAIGNDTLSSYSTLTDEKGEFYFNLPAGIYTVKLSEAAFDDQFQPTDFAQQADLLNNETKTVYFTIRQKKRRINIKRK